MNSCNKHFCLVAALALIAAIATGCATPQERRNEEIRAVRSRLVVMRYAVEAFLKTGNPEAAADVERAMHARELAIEGDRSEQAQQIRRRAPNRDRLAELLGAASNLYASWRKPERAAALKELSGVYAEQWRRQERAEREGRTSERERPQRRGRGLDSLERRVQFLEIARQAYDEAGHERNERALAAAVRYGRLQLGDGNEQALARAAEGLPSSGNLIELLQGAHNLLAEQDKRERAMACNDLAEFYAARERGRRVEAEPEPERQRPRWGELESRERRIEVLRLARIAHREAGNGRAAKQMERILHLAELQLEGADDKAIAEASEGLSQGMIIELVQAAAGLYAEWRAPDRADMCRRLVESYRRRAEGGEGDGERGGDERGKDREVTIRELEQRLERMQREVRQIEEMLRRLSK